MTEAPPPGNPTETGELPEQLEKSQVRTGTTHREFAQKAEPYGTRVICTSLYVHMQYTYVHVYIYTHIHIQTAMYVHTYLYTDIERESVKY